MKVKKENKTGDQLAIPFSSLSLGDTFSNARTVLYIKTGPKEAIVYCEPEKCWKRQQYEPEILVFTENATLIWDNKPFF